jgi:nitrate reductase gamma subunit
MNDIYNFLSGPMVWVAFIIFIGGSLYRLVAMVMLVKQKEPFIFSYMSLKYGARSIIHWITPFATENMRKHPGFTVASFAFHICALVTPLFLLSHIVLFDETWDINWWSLPDTVADIMTIIVIAVCIFFLIRRLYYTHVKFLTSTTDYVILAIVATPFITGFLANHQWFGYKFFFLFHIISGEIMLMSIPFTRLSHMLFAFLTRSYIGSEFGKVRHARDW